jgi:hypothetical protein
MTWPLILFTLPTLLQGYVIGLLAFMFGLVKNPRFHRGVLQWDWRPWFDARWRYSTTIGACMGLHSTASAKTEWHEFVHIKQYEDLNLLAVIISGLCCIVSWRLGLIIWCSSGVLWLLPNFISGWIREGDPYRGSEHERSAYAQANYYLP